MNQRMMQMLLQLKQNPAKMLAQKYNLPQESGYSFESRGGDVIEKYGDSQFLNIIAGKDSREVFKIINEMVEAVSVLNPKLHRAFLSRLSSLDDKIID